MSQQFCLKWNNHMNNMMDVFKNLLSTEAMVDVTLACDGLSLKAHKIVLSACSPFFQSLFLENPCKHPIVILKDMKYTELKAIIEFMYHGEVNVAQDQLSALMKTAETLRVKGLAEVTNEKNTSNNEESSHRSVPRTDTPPPKRRRGRTRKRSISDHSDDEASEPKIKQPDSPDIEELSGDMDPSTPYSNASTVPMPSHSTNSFHKSSQQEHSVEQGADESFAPEEKFGVEPSKLLEQTLTTDDLPRRSGRSSVQSNMELQRRPRSSTDHSTSLVPVTPTSMPSDALVVANQQPESPPDIKPELLDLEPPMSPVAGPSHSTDENSMMMYMDQSSMSGLPGPSGYQDNSALVSTDSQPQDISLSTFVKMEHHNFAAEEYQMVALGNSALENKEEPCDDNDDSGVNDLKTLLASSSRGKLLLLHYTTCNEFTSIHRSHLADLLIAHELQKDMNKGLNREIFIQLTMKIVNTFPTEDIDNWIINAMYPDKIVFDGKLIRRYNTWVDVTKCAPFSMVPDDYQITTELDDEQNSVVEVSLAYLKIATTPWSTIEDLWIKTERSRNEDILTLKVDIYDYFQAFPCLREPLGYTLFEKDFQFLYPASFSNLFAEWPKLSIFIKHELQKKDENFLNGNVSSAEKRVMSILMHLSQIFPVVTAMVKSGVGHWRPSRAEAQASFFLVVKSHKELQPIIERRSDKLKKYGLNLQPLPVIIGNTEMYHQCFIIFDTVVYEVDNPLKALDLTFKIFHAFQMQYPPECEQIWTFLQKAVYKIHTDNDKVLIGTSDLIIKYNNFQERKLHVILSN